MTEHNQHPAEAWMNLMGMERLQASMAVGMERAQEAWNTFEEFDRQRVEHTTQAIDQWAKLTKDSMAYNQRLARAWSRLFFEAAHATKNVAE